MKKIACIIVALLLAGCLGSEHDEAWFRAHPAERNAKLDGCRADSKALNNDKECQAAYAAEEVKPVTYWKENGLERQTRLVECKEFAAAIGRTGNCINAGEAAIKQLGGGKPIYLNK